MPYVDHFVRLRLEKQAHIEARKKSLQKKKEKNSPGQVPTSLSRPEVKYCLVVFCESETRLVYRANSRPSRNYVLRPYLKETNKKLKNTLKVDK